jgi:dihydrodipicolinate synthase/N-acetylneuraminate lyase
MENPDLQGIFGVVPTPLASDGEVDVKGLGALVEHCADSGLHAAVILGSNGEFPYFSAEEKARILRSAADAAGGKIPLVAGVSSYSTPESIALAKIAAEAGYAAVLAALNVYFALDLEAVKSHFTVLSKEGGLPVIFYYFPEVTGLVLAPDEIAEIAAVPGIHGAKITVVNRTFLKRIIKLTRTDLWAVFAGTSFLMRDALKLGGAGVICPLPLIVPRESMELYRMMEKGKLDEARDVQDMLLAALPMFTGVDMPDAVAAPWFKAMKRRPYTGPPERPVSSIALVKEALRLQGHPITSVVRRPNPPLTHEQANLVEKVLREQNWL